MKLAGIIHRRIISQKVQKGAKFTLITPKSSRLPFSLMKSTSKKCQSFTCWGPLTPECTHPKLLTQLNGTLVHLYQLYSGAKACKNVGFSTCLFHIPNSFDMCQIGCIQDQTPKQIRPKHDVTKAWYLCATSNLYTNRNL